MKELIKNSNIEDCDFSNLNQPKDSKELTIAAAMMLTLLAGRKSNKKYEIPAKTEKEKQVEEYFKGYYCYCYEKENMISMKKSTISLQELKDVAQILEVDDLTFDVSHDYDGYLESTITWKDKIKPKYDCNCADWGMMNHLSDCPAKR